MILITGKVLLESRKEYEHARTILIKRAQRSREDPGCIDYAFSQNLENPLEIRIAESWESNELLQAHLQVPDPEFEQLISTAAIVSASVVANEVSGTNVLMER